MVCSLDPTLGLACTEGSGAPQASPAFMPRLFCDYGNLWWGRDAWEAAPQEQPFLSDGRSWGVTTSVWLRLSNEATAAQSRYLLSSVPSIHFPLLSSPFPSLMKEFLIGLVKLNIQEISVLRDEVHFTGHGACLLMLCWTWGTRTTFEGFSWDDQVSVEPIYSLIGVEYCQEEGVSVGVPPPNTLTWF